jgi:hypothetical protein
MLECVACAWTLGALLLGEPTARPAEKPPELELVLARLARVADLYRGQALSFTCDESIYVSGKGRSAQHRFRYIYVVADGKLDERREPVGNSAPGRSLEDLPELLKRPYSWLFVFEPKSRPLYRFVLEEREASVLGAPALAVRFEAVPPLVRGGNEWDGTVFVDPRTFQPLRVVARLAWEPRGFRVYTTDFDVVENGMRFPSQVRLQTWYGQLLKQTYKDYRFFGVRAREEIERYVLEGD